MNNKDLIRRLISFDDESVVDISTGFVDVGHTAGDLYWKPDITFQIKCDEYLPKSSMTYTGLSWDKSCIGINLYKYITKNNINIPTLYQKQFVCVSLVIPTVEIDGEVYVSYDDFVNVVENADIPYIVMRDVLSKFGIRHAVKSYIEWKHNYGNEDNDVDLPAEKLLTEILNEKIIPMFLRMRDKLLKTIKTKMKGYCIRK